MADQNLSYMKHLKLEKVALRNHPDLRETWVQQVIAEDPSILGLGDVILKDKERIQMGTGRLDLLLQDAETNHRYEVEIQLGKTDETHIIRTIEYWDIERKRYPQYEHTAVLVAEDITSRFFNVIGLFNGHIPLVAIQMTAFKVGSDVSLVFTKVVDALNRGLVDEDEEVREVTDRNYWENRGSKATVKLADEVWLMIKEFIPGLELKYNKFYIGLAKGGIPVNFAIFRPQKAGMLLEIKLKESEELETTMDQAGLDMLDYQKRSGRYRIKVKAEDLKKHRSFLADLLRKSAEEDGRVNLA